MRGYIESIHIHPELCEYDSCIGFAETEFSYVDKKNNEITREVGFACDEHANEIKKKVEKRYEEFEK